MLIIIRTCIMDKFVYETWMWKRTFRQEKKEGEMLKMSPKKHNTVKTEHLELSPRKQNILELIAALARKINKWKTTRKRKMLQKRPLNNNNLLLCHRL